jgi:hypothetical protein
MNLKIVKPSTDPERATQTTMDTIVITPAEVAKWLNPPFQRPLRVNAKVRAIAEKIKETEVLPGIVTLGVLAKDTYLLDGQHRREAFLISGVLEGYCDVRVHHFASMADMGREFVELNSRIVNLRPDDILRGLEGSNEALVYLRKQLPFVGYDMIRRNERAPILSMSLMLRSWFASSYEVPSSASTGSAMNLGESLTMETAHECVAFFRLCEKAWGRDSEYSKLWGSLNLTICAWLYRRVVLSKDPKVMRVSPDLFCKGMMALSASDNYMSWLIGRMLADRDRSPCYSRMKTLVVKRIELETGKKLRWPQPSWAHGGGGRP